MIVWRYRAAALWAALLLCGQWTATATTMPDPSLNRDFLFLRRLAFELSYNNPRVRHAFLLGDKGATDSHPRPLEGRVASLLIEKNPELSMWSELKTYGGESGRRDLCYKGLKNPPEIVDRWERPLIAYIDFDGDDWIMNPDLLGKRWQTLDKPQPRFHAGLLLVSLGEDGELDTEDDIVSWRPPEDKVRWYDSVLWALWLLSIEPLFFMVVALPVVFSWLLVRYTLQSHFGKGHFLGIRWTGAAYCLVWLLFPWVGLVLVVLAFLYMGIRLETRANRGPIME